MTSFSALGAFLWLLLKSYHRALLPHIELNPELFA